MSDLKSLLGVAVLMSAFPLAQWSGRLTLKMKRRWEALSAGVAVAYMFVGVLPELMEHGPTVAASAVGTLLSTEKRIYSWALAGFVAFAGLSELQSRGGEERTRGPVYWGKLSGFALYVLLIGDLLVHHEDTSMRSLWLYSFAMGLHIFMLDIAMAEQFRGLYESRGRLALACSVFLGWMLGSVNLIPEAFTARLLAFILGGVSITAAHEELRAERARHYWWFVSGAAAYATILLLV